MRFKIAGIMKSVHSGGGSRDTVNYYLSCHLSPKFSDKHLPFSVKYLILLVRYMITSSRVYFLKSKPKKQGTNCQISGIFTQLGEKIAYYQADLCQQSGWWWPDLRCHLQLFFMFLPRIY